MTRANYRYSFYFLVIAMFGLDVSVCVSEGKAPTQSTNSKNNTSYNTIFALCNQLFTAITLKAELLYNCVYYLLLSSSRGRRVE